MAESGDPFGLPESTMRPRPGGKRGSPDPTGVRAAGTSMMRAEPIAPEIRDRLAIGLNPLLQAASALLALAGQLRGSSSAIDVAALRIQTLGDIGRFEDRSRALGVAEDDIVSARYILCATLDEAAQSTPWGTQSVWAQNPLLFTLHHETWGGEKFFVILERLLANPARYIDLMELQYICLAFGFTGKYKVLDRGDERLSEVQRDLYRRIRAQRGAPKPELSLRWRGLEDRRNPLIRYVPLWVVGAAALAILTAAYTFYSARLAASAGPVQRELSRIGVEDFVPDVKPRPPTPGPTLKQLLATEEQRGTLRVVEQGGRSVVTLAAGDLFGSGSATVNPQYRATLQSVSSALNQVPGRVLVVGHTDDQPVRSLRYRDNFELSRERAVSVAAVLGETLNHPARLSVNGVGSTEPLEPGPAAENRSRNRRVEIIHVRGT